MTHPTSTITRPTRAQLRARIATLRAQNPMLRMVSAYYQARDELTTAPPRFDLLGTFPENQPVTGVICGFTVTVRIEPDRDNHPGDDDVTGLFTDDYEPGCLRSSNPEYKWYRPSNVIRANLLNALRRDGMSKSVAQDTYRQIVHEHMRIDASTEYIGVIATVTLNGYHLADNSLWGIGLSPEFDSEAYLREVAEECVDEALSDAHNKPSSYLRHLRASPPGFAPALAAGQLESTTASEQFRRPAITALPDGELRIFEPEGDDPSRMYVLDVLGINLLIRVQLDKSTYVHVDESDSWETYSPPLLVEVFNGGDTQHGPDAIPGEHEIFHDGTCVTAIHKP